MLTCQRQKVCVQTILYIGVFPHPIHEPCVLKSCCDWLSSVRCCHLVDKEVHFRLSKVVGTPNTTNDRKTFPLTVTASVCVCEVWILHPYSFPISDGDLNVPRTCFGQCITAASLNICSAFSCKPVWLIAKSGRHKKKKKSTCCVQIMLLFLKS